MTDAKPRKNVQNEPKTSRYTKKQENNQRLLRLYQKDSGVKLKILPHQPQMGSWGIDKGNNWNLNLII